MLNNILLSSLFHVHVPTYILIIPNGNSIFCQNRFYYVKKVLVYLVLLELL